MPAQDQQNRVRQLPAIVPIVLGEVNQRLHAMGLEAIAPSALSVVAVDVGVSLSYWVRWKKDDVTHRGFLTVRHAWASVDNGRLVAVTIADTPALAGGTFDARVRYAELPQIDASLLDAVDSSLGVFPDIRAMFDGPAILPITAAELNSMLSLKAAISADHHLGGNNFATVRVEGYSTLLPAAFALGGKSIPVADYAVPDLRGVVLMSSDNADQFEQGRSGSGWLLGGRPLAIQAAGNEANEFKEGFGQLTSFALSELSAALGVGPIEIVRIG